MTERVDLFDSAYKHFTDGPVTNDELALRSSIGLFLFVPPGINERLINQAGFNLSIRKT